MVALRPGRRETFLAGPRRMVSIKKDYVLIHGIKIDDDEVVGRISGSVGWVAWFGCPLECQHFLN